MSYCFLAYIRIHDEGGYQEYLDRADEVFARYNGRYLTVDNEPEILKFRLKAAQCDSILVKGK